MSSRFHHRSRPDIHESGELPPGCPQWVTEELIARTIEVWQPYYEAPLTLADALEMTLGAGRLFETLQREPEP